MEHIRFLLIGTYTKGKSEGIYVYRLNQRTGEPEYVGMAAAENPSYLVADSTGRFIYAVSENEEEPSYANAFSFDPVTGELTFLNREETRGGGSCHIAVSGDGKHVVTANYAGGSITVFPVESDGTLQPASQVIEFGGQGVDAERQEAPHLHCVKFSPDGKFLFATDLGTDKIYRFETDPGTEDYVKEESLMLFKVEDGSGPRHFVFHPSGKFLYLICELAGTVIGFTCENGDLTEIQTVVADELHARSSADIAVIPDGKYLFASNREQADGVAIFSINEETGMLSKIGYQSTAKHPRNILLTPEGDQLLVAGMESNKVEVYQFDAAKGELQNRQQDIPVDSPVCLLLI